MKTDHWAHDVYVHEMRELLAENAGAPDMQAYLKRRVRREWKAIAAYEQQKAARKDQG